MTHSRKRVNNFRFKVIKNYKIIINYLNKKWMHLGSVGSPGAPKSRIGTGLFSLGRDKQAIN